MLSGNHYGLEFVMQASVEDIDCTIKALTKPNRKAKEVKITKHDKQMLKVGLRERQRIRRQKEEERQRRHPK